MAKSTGKFLKCVDELLYNTQGSLYEVFVTDNGSYYILDDDNDERFEIINRDFTLDDFYSDNFEAVETPKDKQEFSVGDKVVINKISDDSVSDVDDVNIKFKVGDPVYFPRLSNKLCVIGEGQEDDYVDEVNGSKALAEMQSDLNFVYDQKTKSWLWDEKDCAPQLLYATQENYELLSKLYPHIEFELPPKEITGSDLCRAMLEKGWHLVPCVVSNISDSDALNNDNCCLVDEWWVGSFDSSFNSGDYSYKYAVPFDPKTGIPLTEDVLNETTNK